MNDSDRSITNLCKHYTDEQLKQNFYPGTFGCHEAMHMALVLAEMVGARLCDHPTIILSTRWSELAEKAEQALHALYQAMGEQHVNKEIGAAG